MMDSNIPILPPGRIARPLGVHSNRIQGAKVSSYPSNFIFKDFMVEAGLEFTLADLGCRYVSGFLTSAKDDLQGMS